MSRASGDDSVPAAAPGAVVLDGEESPLRFSSVRRWMCTVIGQ